MKKILVVRHAKSSWDNPTLDDFYRPLNKRGVKDAIKMAEFVKKKCFKVDFFLSSPAERAFSTAKTFAKTLDYPIENIKTIQAFYNFSDNGDLILSEVKNCDANIECVAVFGHNNTFFNLVSRLSKAEIKQFSTCSVALVGFDVETWEETRLINCKVEFFASPKTIFT